MIKIGNIYKYQGKAIENYRYGRTFVEVIYNCNYHKKMIIAESPESKIFDSDCRAKDLKCSFSDSIIVWDQEVIHKCPFKRLMNHELFRVDHLGFTSLKKNVRFIFKSLVRYCDQTLIYTVEGVYIAIYDNTDTLI